MNARGILPALLALSMWAIVSSAQGVWAKKEWQKWSQSDCKTIQEDSPWAQKFTFGEVVQDGFGQPTQGAGRATEQQYYYVIQFRSALPVRQALIRNMQIQNKYDRMTADQKKQFDESAQDFLNRKYEDVIVVHVYYGASVEMDAREMARLWHGYSTGTVPKEAALITSKGDRIPPARFVAAPGSAMEFELIFPRIIEGRPLITPEVKSVAIEFQHPSVLGKASERVYKEFKVGKMMLNGELVY